LNLARLQKNLVFNLDDVNCDKEMSVTGDNDES